MKKISVLFFALALMSHGAPALGMESSSVSRNKEQEVKTDQKICFQCDKPIANTCVINTEISESMYCSACIIQRCDNSAPARKKERGLGEQVGYSTGWIKGFCLNKNLMPFLFGGLLRARMWSSVLCQGATMVAARALSDSRVPDFALGCLEYVRTLYLLDVVRKVSPVDFEYFGL